MFIQELSKHLHNADVNITFSKTDGIITVILLPKPKNDKISDLQPIIAKGTAEELDKFLLESLKPVFKAIEGFKVVGVEKAIEDIKVDEETASRPSKSRPNLTPKSALPNAKALFDDGMKLFKEAKYAEALPLFKLASETKPENKAYAEGLKNCQRWVDSMKSAGLFEEAKKDFPKTMENLEDEIEEVEEFPEVDEDENNGPIEEPVEEDDDDFPI